MSAAVRSADDVTGLDARDDVRNAMRSITPSRTLPPSAAEGAGLAVRWGADDGAKPEWAAYTAEDDDDDWTPPAAFVCMLVVVVVVWRGKDTGLPLRGADVLRMGAAG